MKRGAMVFTFVLLSAICAPTVFADAPFDDALLVPDWKMWKCHQWEQIYANLSYALCDVPNAPDSPGALLWHEGDREPIAVMWGYDTTLPKEEARKRMRAALRLSDGRWVFGRAIGRISNNGNRFTVAIYHADGFEIGSVSFNSDVGKK